MPPPNLPERVAVLENEFHNLDVNVEGIRNVQGHQEATLNTICVTLATLTTEVKNITMERAVWKNPLIYITFMSVVVAGVALIK
jgi:hypothetical protein